MKLRKYGGDNRDHGKGFVFHHLADQLRDFHVDPMISDEDLPAGAQRLPYLDAYRRFLRLADTGRIINGDANYRGARTVVVRNGVEEPYFEPHIKTDYDLFLDPDNGIGDSGPKHVPRQ